MEPDPERTREAWRCYVETGQVRRDLLREHIHRAWSRCRAAGTSPLAMEARRLSPAETAELLARKRRLIDASRPYLRALSRVAGDERHAAMLADETGTLLDVVGDEETIFRTEGFPGPGTLLSEACGGANGIGTPLAEGRYVEIVGPEHFIEGFHVYTCQGLPLRGPQGEVAGVLSMSLRRIEVAERIREILICAARGVEAELWSARLEQDVERILGPTSEAEGTFEKLRQDLVQIHAAARLRLDEAVRAARKDRPGDVLDLVRTATQLIQRFQQKARLWREIASDELGVAEPLDLQDRLVEMAELLRTEMAVRRVTVAVRPGPPLLVLADARDLSRRLFRGFLRALETAPPGSMVDLAPEVAPGAGAATWVFSVDTDGAPAYPLAALDGEMR